MTELSQDGLIHLCHLIEMFEEGRGRPTRTHCDAYAIDVDQVPRDATLLVIGAVEEGKRVVLPLKNEASP